MAEAQYQVVGQVQASRIDPATNRPVAGWNITAQDLVTQQVFTVFLPGNPTPQAAAEAIGEQLVRIRQIHGLTGA